LSGNNASKPVKVAHKISNLHLQLAQVPDEGAIRYTPGHNHIGDTLAGAK